MARILQAPREVKPIPYAPLERSHPLARGLVGAWLLNEGQGRAAYDGTGQIALSFAGSPAWTATQGGPGIKFTATAGDYLSGTILSPRAGKPFTLVVSYALNPSFAVAGTPLAMGNVSGTDQIAHFLIAANRAQISLNQFSDDTAFTVPTIPLSAVQVSAFVSTTTQRTLFHNGVQIGTSAIAAYAGDATVTLGALAPSRSNVNNFDGVVLWALVYDRALSVAELAQLAHEPYAIYGAGAPRHGALLTSALYPHNAASSGVTRPSGIVSTMVAGTASKYAATALAMDKTPGTAQAAIANATNTTANVLAAQFLSAPLAAQTIPAGQWTVGFGFYDDAVATTLNKAVAAVHLMTSAGALRQTLYNSTGTGQQIVAGGYVGTEAAAVAQPILASVAVTAGDYLCLEIGVANDDTTQTAYFDGTQPLYTSLQAPAPTSARAVLIAPGTLAPQFAVTALAAPDPLVPADLPAYLLAGTLADPATPADAATTTLLGSGISLSLLDPLLPADAIAALLGLLGADSLPGADALAGLLSQVGPDPLAPADVLAGALSLAGADPLAPSEAIAGSLLAAPGDPLAPQDTLAGALGSALAEALTPADSAADLLATSGAESLAGSDTLAGAFGLARADSLVPQEGLSGLLSLAGADALVPADSAAAVLFSGIALTILDSLTPQDAAQALAGLLGADPGAPQDSLAGLLGLAGADALAPADLAVAALYAGLTLLASDALAPSDAATLAAALGLADPLAPQDAAGLLAALASPDPLAPQDAAALLAQAGLTDALSPLDSLALALALATQDPLLPADLAAAVLTAGIAVLGTDPLIPADLAQTGALAGLADPLAGQDLAALALAAALADALIAADLVGFVGGGTQFAIYPDPLGAPSDGAALVASLIAADPQQVADAIAAAFVAQPSAVLYDPLVPADAASLAALLAGADALVATDQVGLYVADAAWRGSGRVRILAISIGPRVLVLRDGPAAR